jgi:capsular exopolysaccharide synthesis family protein
MWAAGRKGLQLREGATYVEDNANFAGTQIELIQSGLVLGRAFDRVRTSLHMSFPTNSLGKPELPTVKVLQLPRSAVLRLRAKGPSKALVIAFLNAAMDEFLAYKKEVRTLSSGDSYASVSERTVKQEGELKAEQDKLTTYMRDNNVAVLEEQAKAAGVYLTQLLAALSELQLQYQLLEANSAEQPWGWAVITNTLAGAAELRRPGSFVPLSPSLPPEFVGAQQELEKARIMRLRLGKHLRPEHPKMVKLDEQIAQSEKLVEYFSRNSLEQLAEARQTAKLRIDRMQETIKDWEAKVNTASVRIAEYERLKLSVGQLQELHDHLLALLQTVDVSNNLDQENLTILDRPVEAFDAKKSTLFTALVLGLGLGAGLAFVALVERRDDRVISAEDLIGRFPEWVLGQIPELPRPQKNHALALLTINDQRRVFAESHRKIRSALWFALDEAARPRALLVTSAIAGEGKSTLAANLASAMAFAGSRVLLIDADLRHGILHELFQQSAQPGLVDVLSFNAAPPFASYLLPTSVPNLTLLPRGSPRDNSSELLLGSNCDRLLANARNDFDCVILDSSPIMAADDTTCLAPKVDGVLLVVRNSFSRAGAIRHALNLLYERQAKVMGLVLNRSDSRSLSFRYFARGNHHPFDKTRRASARSA